MPMNGNTLRRLILKLGGRWESNRSSPTEVHIEAYFGKAKAAWWESRRTHRMHSVYVRGVTHGQGDASYHTTAGVLSALFGHSHSSQAPGRGWVTAHRSLTGKGKTFYTLILHGRAKGEKLDVVVIPVPTSLAWVVPSYLDNQLPPEVLLDILEEANLIPDLFTSSAPRLPADAQTFGAAVNGGNQELVKEYCRQIAAAANKVVNGIT